MTARPRASPNLFRASLRDSRSGLSSYPAEIDGIQHPGKATDMQTFDTTRNVTEGVKNVLSKTTQRTVGPNTDASDYEGNFVSTSSVDGRKHHRKFSSFSNVSLLGAPLFTEVEQTSGTTQRRVATTNFMQNLDDENFVPNLSSPTTNRLSNHKTEDGNKYADATVENPAQPFLNPSPSYTSSPPKDTNVDSSKSPLSVQDPAWDNTASKITGSASKRMRRKCTFPECHNRVVQGGLCISHGAKRKICGNPGCTKNVKKAGMCSAHGPARKRCEFERCVKVSVQGGKCIAHGAKKKMCFIENCTKQAIFSGMCKKHHDQTNGIANTGHGKRSTDENNVTKEINEYCSVIGLGSESYTLENPLPEKKNLAKPSHRRGLSIFQDMSTVDRILSQENANAEDGSESLCLSREIDRNKSSQMVNANLKTSPQPSHKRGLSIFVDDDVAESIIQNPSIME
eukprot:CAMPEP_0197841502 /NCGR_PEP_ID=MMETSP1437-20131217/46219_1 /TAXON_ID=49252 ORGANISM="Eucampia antarctica, Strain CCMP1452" /NCGR_SAMPLE_ID=MMETSP1437 /ASSEMBLY_ACC=CAM_ASM_001096 /LENGTH=454 /DNA_ID=CAMNT_0043451275 /DNA_START=554 /DNA_END=1918 /DNA_ORIENTATION=-